MKYEHLIGLEVYEATEILNNLGITNFKFVYYVDRKQAEYDKELVTAVQQHGEELHLIVCRYKLSV
ncbi:MAG: hypothetical protein IJZ28_01670 [Clostridia bacterium]|nr:hypothetical protein [Clostridia bacterium]